VHPVQRGARRQVDLLGQDLRTRAAIPLPQFQQREVYTIPLPGQSDSSILMAVGRLMNIGPKDWLISISFPR
jgi:hypothetical protein